MFPAWKLDWLVISLLCSDISLMVMGSGDQRETGTGRLARQTSHLINIILQIISANITLNISADI